MHRLRHARILASLVLAWFALTLGVGVAAPVMDPAFAGWICSATPGPVAPASDDGSSPSSGAAAGHGLQCPLCASLIAPPPQDLSGSDILLPSHPGYPTPSAPAPSVHIAAPQAARGPPSLDSF